MHKIKIIINENKMKYRILHGLKFPPSHVQSGYTFVDKNTTTVDLKCNRKC